MFDFLIAICGQVGSDLSTSNIIRIDESRRIQEDLVSKKKKTYKNFILFCSRFVRFNLHLEWNNLTIQAKCGHLELIRNALEKYIFHDKVY